jgi:hypothetical protein
MMRILILLLVFLTAFIQCAPEKPKSDTDQHLKSKSGLKIEYKPTRGQGYTDPNGVEYSLRHIPATFTNDTTISIHLQMSFAKDYDYPNEYNAEKFKVFPMPKAWNLDGVEITDDMLMGLSAYIDTPILSKTLEPGEKWLIALGTLYPRPINYGVFPVAVCSHDNRALYHGCKSLIDPGKLDILPLALELIIGFTSGSQTSPESCIMIPCGQISYLES